MANEENSNIMQGLELANDNASFVSILSKIPT